MPNMIQSSCFGLSGKKYILGKRLGVGGEGTVYEIDGDSSLAAKIYNSNRFKDNEEKHKMECKLKMMIDMKIQTTIDGLIRLAWPQDILHNENGEIVGFTMPRINASHKIYDIHYPHYYTKFIELTWKNRVQYAYNLSWVVWHLHLNNVIIGNLDPNNIVIEKNGNICLIDCDSFDIRDHVTGEHFPCVVGREDMLAPELQTVGPLLNGNFTKESDNFSLAIHIFRLLMNDYDPFDAIMTGQNIDSETDVACNSAIINGECLYFRDIPGKIIPKYAPKLEILPPDIASAFERTFNYTPTNALSNITNRTTAEEWNRLLLKYAQAEPNPHLKTCRKHADHVYSAHLEKCHFCTQKKSMRRTEKVCAAKMRIRILYYGNLRNIFKYFSDGSLIFR